MKPTSRIATAAAFALALFVAPATFADEGNPEYDPPREQAPAQCTCMGQPHEGAAEETKGARPNTTEAPVFTDQG